LAKMKPWRAVYCKLHTRISRASSSQKYLKIQATTSMTWRLVELVWLSAPPILSVSACTRHSRHALIKRKL
jgi:hypothetical protein